MDEWPSKEWPDARQFLDHGDSRHNVLSKPAMRLRDGQAAQTHLRQLAEQVAWPVMRLVPRAPLVARGLLGDKPSQLAA